MHLVFINYANFHGPSGVHIFHLANALVDHGLSCTVLVPGNPERVEIFGCPRFRVLIYRDAIKGLRHLSPQLIHAWTPRESTRWMTKKISRAFNIPYIVHLEDSETAIFQRYLASPHGLQTLWRLFRLNLPLKRIPISHPKRYKEFLHQAAGVTAIIDTLTHSLPSHLPSLVFWPGCEEEIFDIPLEPDWELRAELGLTPQDWVVLWAGHTHGLNKQDMRDLYQAVQLVRKQGISLRVLRIGRDLVTWNEGLTKIAKSGWREMGDLYPAAIPDYLRATDILVHPGRAGDYNQYRLPSKLPMFLASGRPVITARLNIGHYLSHGQNALVLETSTSQAMAKAMLELIKAPGLRRTIGKNGREFAKAQFSWAKAAKKCISFYRRIQNI